MTISSSQIESANPVSRRLDLTWRHRGRNLDRQFLNVIWKILLRDYIALLSHHQLERMILFILGRLKKNQDETKHTIVFHRNLNTFMPIVWFRFAQSGMLLSIAMFSYHFKRLFHNLMVWPVLTSRATQPFGHKILFPSVNPPPVASVSVIKVSRKIEIILQWEK